MFSRSIPLSITPSAPSGRPGAARLLEVEELGLEGSRAEARVSFHVGEGEIVGVAGVEGNGQQELCETLAGIRRAAAGRVRLRGVDVTELEQGMAVLEAGDIGQARMLLQD